jgi:hypothetical protein
MAVALALPLPLVDAGGAMQGVLTWQRNYRALAGRTLIGQGPGTLTGITAALMGAGARAGLPDRPGDLHAASRAADECAEFRAATSLQFVTISVCSIDIHARQSGPARAGWRRGCRSGKSPTHH